MEARLRHYYYNTEEQFMPRSAQILIPSLELSIRHILLGILQKALTIGYNAMPLSMGEI